MLNYAGEASEAGNDSDRTTTVARLYIYTRVCKCAIMQAHPAWVRINSQMLWQLHFVWEVKPGTQLYISCESNKTMPGCEAPDARRCPPGLTVIIAPPTHVWPQLTVASLAHLTCIV